MNNVSHTGSGFGSCGQIGKIEFFSATNTYALCNGTQWTYFKYAPCPPSAFSFNNLTNQSRSAQVNSNIVQITGMGCDGPVTVSGGSGEYRVCSDSSCASVVQNWTSGYTALTSGQYLQLRVTTAASALTARSVDITVGGSTDNWSATTASGWKIAFLSPTARPATLGSVAGIDTYCQNTANGAGLGGTYKGWVSGAAGQDPATTFTQSSVPYRLTTGTAIANNWADLIDGTLAAAINVSESGSTIATTMEVWSNTNANGTRIGAVNCGNWSSPAGSGRHGTASSATATWSDTNQLACSNYRRFYCFQQ